MSSLSPSPIIYASLRLPFAVSLRCFLHSIKLLYCALVPSSDCIWLHLCNKFTALAALRESTRIPEYSPLRLLRYYCIYLPFSGGLPLLAVWATLSCQGGLTIKQLHTASKSFWSAARSFIPFSLLKSRSALLFINCRFTTPLVFPAAPKIQLWFRAESSSASPAVTSLMKSFRFLKESSRIFQVS